MYILRVNNSFKGRPSTSALLYGAPVAAVFGALAAGVHLVYLHRLGNRYLITSSGFVQQRRQAGGGAAAMVALAVSVDFASAAEAEAAARFVRKLPAGNVAKGDPSIPVAAEALYLAALRQLPECAELQARAAYKEKV